MLAGEGHNLPDGEEQAWQMLSELDYTIVCSNALADFDESSNYYILPIFNVPINISPKTREIWGNTPLADLLLNKLSFYSRLSVIW